MKIDEIDKWREAFGYADCAQPNINYTSIADATEVNRSMISAFLQGVEYAENNPESTDRKS